MFGRPGLNSHFFLLPRHVGDFYGELHGTVREAATLRGCGGGPSFMLLACFPEGDELLHQWVDSPEQEICRGRCGRGRPVSHQNVAIGLTGDPVAPTMTNGATVNMKSYRPSVLLSSVSAAKSALSTRVKPNAAIAP
jgi:hypothetical protein